MHTLPPTLSSALAVERQRDLHASAGRGRRTRHRSIGVRRVRRWASGWFDRAVPGLSHPGWTDARRVV